MGHGYEDASIESLGTHAETGIPKDLERDYGWAESRIEWYEGENEKRWRGGRQEGRIEEGYGEGQLTLKKPHGNPRLLTDSSYEPSGQFKVLEIHSIFCSKP